MKVHKEVFGQIPGSGEASLFSVSNENGIVLRVSDYGASVQAILVPDKKGISGDVVLGFDTLAGYLQEHPYIGTIVGRYANRIAGGRFTIDGKEYRLAQNHGQNHIHGGALGFDKVLWEAEDFADREGAGVSLSYFSHDMEEGYPGNLQVRITYTLDEDNRVVIDYKATCDRPTHLNLTNHSYFNLSGSPEKIHDHEMTINASEYVVADSDGIPTGEIRSVEGSLLDLRQPKRIGDVIEKLEGGFDHCYVLGGDGTDPVMAARVFHPASGRVMETFTTEPGIQFYSGNFLGGIRGKEAADYNVNNALCLEAQHYPDSPNHPEFPSTLLSPGETYRQQTIYKFSVL